MIRRGLDEKILNLIAYIVNGVIALACLIPFIMVLAGSFSSEGAIRDNGFSLLPQDFSLEAYNTVFKDPGSIGKAYFVTIWTTAVGTILGLFINTMTAYVISRKDFAWRNRISFFFYFTTLFSGGLVPSYVLMTRYLGLRNNYLVLILPLLFSVYNLLILKSYIHAVPDSLIESAKMDGCGEFRCMVQIVMPMLTSGMATIALFLILGGWNDWYNAMLYLQNRTMWPLQYFLYNQVNNIEAYKRIIQSQAGSNAAMAINMPTQTLKMALTVVVTGPIILAYPIIQRYFVQGITIGAVKG
jgi:putative aldouronate transport system permease protein